MNRKNHDFLHSSSTGQGESSINVEGSKLAKDKTLQQMVHEQRHSQMQGSLSSLRKSQEVDDNRSELVSEHSDLTEKTETEPYMTDNARSFAAKSIPRISDEVEVIKMFRSMLDSMSDMISTSASPEELYRVMSKKKKEIEVSMFSPLSKPSCWPQRRSKSGSEAMLRSHQEAVVGFRGVHMDYDDPELTSLPHNAKFFECRDGATAPSPTYHLNSHFLSVDGEASESLSASPPTLAMTTLAAAMVASDGSEPRVCAPKEKEPDVAELVRVASECSTGSSGSAGGSKLFLLSPRSAFDDRSVSSQNSDGTNSVDKRMFM